MIERADMATRIGPANVLPHVAAAVERARAIHAESYAGRHITTSRPAHTW
jgi:hypothetical protein